MVFTTITALVVAFSNAEDDYALTGEPVTFDKATFDDGFELSNEFRRKELDTSRARNAIKLTDSDRQALLDVHNEWRNMAALGKLNGGKKAVFMNKLYWDNELEQHAQDYSRSCQWLHSSKVGYNELGYRVGENLFATTRIRDKNERADLLVDGIDMWGDEHEFFDHDTLACSKPPCGHYTAMVWDDTTRVGCAVTECSGMIGLPSWKQATYLVCQYHNAGNWIGQKPYQYSRNGKTGTGCKDGMDRKYRGLCANPNDICDGPARRCSLSDTCTSSNPLNGEDTAFSCSAGGCSWTQRVGVQVADPWKSHDGMIDKENKGKWKYCYNNREKCEDWCYANRNANPPCVAVSTHDSNPKFFFPVTTTARKDLERFGGGIISVLTCPKGSAKRQRRRVNWPFGSLDIAPEARRLISSESQQE